MMTMVQLFLLFFIIAFAVVAFLTVRRTQRNRPAVEREDLDAESRTLLRPLAKLQADLAELVAQNKESATVSVVGKEALEEVGRIMEQATASLKIRSDLRRSLRGEYDAKKEIESLEAKLATATNAPERESLQSALDARQAELTHYDTIRQATAQIDGGLRQAEAALAEMKARMAGSVGTEKLQSTSGDDLRESISRMKALSLSYDEAEELLRG